MTDWRFERAREKRNPRPLTRGEARDLSPPKRGEVENPGVYAKLLEMDGS